MKLAWCWRCKAKVPMLDEQEFALVEDAYREGTLEVKLARRLDDRPLLEEDEATILGTVASRYHQITGSSGEVPRDVLKHRLSLVGPACENCGKELRTPLAKKCVECGYLRSSGVDAELSGGPR
jgi:hypothetical protein